MIPCISYRIAMTWKIHSLNCCRKKCMVKYITTKVYSNQHVCPNLMKWWLNKHMCSIVWKKRFLTNRLTYLLNSFLLIRIIVQTLEQKEHLHYLQSLQRPVIRLERIPGVQIKVCLNHWLPKLSFSMNKAVEFSDS